MATVPPLRLLGFSGAYPSRVRPRFTGYSQLRVLRLRDDYRELTPTIGTISDVVVLKSSGVESPFANARVLLLKQADMRKVWQGFSDENGAYTATGLELGVAYIPVAIDPFGNQKSVAAGPVFAT